MILFTALFCSPRPNLPFVLDIAWLPNFAFQSPLMKRIFFLVLVLEVVVGLHRTSQLKLLWLQWFGHRLGLLWYWMVCLGNEQRSFWDHFEIASKYCISDSFVDYEVYSISSKGFLPTVVDIMVISVKFTHSIHFNSLNLKMSMSTLVTSCLTMSSCIAQWSLELCHAGPP